MWGSLKYFLIGSVTLLVAGWYFYPELEPIFRNAQLGMPPPPLNEGEPLPFTLPPQFSATLYSGAVTGARVITRDTAGTLVVSQTSEGMIVALPDKDGNQVADEAVTILAGLNNPHGIIFYENTLYVVEEDVLSSYSYDAATYKATSRKELLALPESGGHYTRSLFMHPWGERLLVAVGSSCNVCNEEDERRAKILAYDIRTGASTEFARGLRNTVFMTLHPVTGDLWGTDMGRDWLGDDTPPDEINILREGKNYGWPTCYGKNIHDTDFDKNTYIRNPCTEPFETESHIDIQAHSAPLGLAFVPEEGWPEEYWHDLFVAYHGSWNRTEPTGYKIVRMNLSPEGQLDGATEDFMTGFTVDGQIIGRPAGILIEPGGVMYVTDDRAGAVYRIAYAP